MHENFTLSSVRKFKMQPPHTYKKRKVEKRTSFILEKVGGGHLVSQVRVLNYHLLGQSYTS